MNILLLNQNWFANELRSMGHTVLTCGTAPHLEHRIPSNLIAIDDLLRGLPHGFSPDRIVWLDNSAPCLIVGLEDCPIPKVLYSVDTHHHHQRHSFLAASFDHVLTAQRDFISHLAVSDSPISWMPLWAPEYVERSDDKRFGATFVGTLNRDLNPARVDFFDALAKLIPIHITAGYYPNIFPHAEIVVNQTVKGDLNFRVFEAMMCGSLVLTERTENGLLELFREDEHLATYTPRDPYNAADKVRALMSNTSRMRAMADAGRDEILAKHTMLHRAIELEKLLGSLRSRTPSPNRYYSAWIALSLDSHLFEPANPAASAHFAHMALNAADKALALGAPPSTEQIALAVRGCIQHDRVLGGDRGACLIAAFAHAFPDLYIFSLLRVRTLLNNGKQQEAVKLAQSISDSPPEHTFYQAEYAASLILA